jgi:hypothetical protein
MIPRKRLIVILGITMISLSLLGYIITVEHWIEIDWNASSYHGVSPLLSLLGTLCYFGILKFDRIPWKRQRALWIMGFIWLGFDLLWLWMVDFK